MKIIGLMSGTSGDGIDAALCEISGQPPHLDARILHGITLPYEDALRQRIFAACDPLESRVAAICQLNFDLGAAFAGAVDSLLQAAGLTPQEIDLIGSHGQTIWHQVDPSGQVTATLQIGETAVIAERTGITTISNFRTRDVAAGGQGAPLTSYADWLLLRHPDHWRAVQNIGGIGNVTFLPPLSDDKNAPLAFDTGPGNVLIDAAVRELTDGKQHYDLDGQIARQGQIDEGWLSELLAHPYFAMRPPKTTGRELFSSRMAQELVQSGQERGLSSDSIVATITSLTAYSIAEAYQNFAPQPVTEIILGGGGARNPMLVTLLQAAVGQRAQVMPHEALGIDSDYKEALVFALLAHETWHNRPGNLPALTGAKTPVVLGQITPGRLVR